MPKGITQEQVNAAADALAVAGDKPTVEKIRQALGTGSPNTVTRMLDAWRGILAQRLQEVIALPDIPSEVGQGFAAIWRMALTHAETLARAALEQEHNALFAAQTSLTQERKLWEIALAEAQVNVADHLAKLAQADVQLRERQVLVEQLNAQQIDLLQQRNRLQQQFDQQAAELDALRAERTIALEHLRTVEDRAHQQVDQVRQELKALQQQLERELREHTKVLTQCTAQQNALQTALRAAEQAAAHHAGRVAALETTLNQRRSKPPSSSKRAAKLSPGPKKGAPRRRRARDAP